MRAEDIALRSEMRQMLNEAGFNRETIKEMVRESLNDIVRNQVNQVLMERREKDLSGAVSDYIESKLYAQVKRCTEDVIREKIRRMEFKMNIDVDINRENEDK